MCGIAGILHRDGSPLGPDVPARLAHMARQLSRRGPDDERTHCQGPLGFIFRRLSIVDLAGGAQPMTNEDGTLQLMVNGENQQPSGAAPAPRGPAQLPQPLGQRGYPAPLRAGRHQTAGMSRLTQRATFFHSELFVGCEDELAQMHQWFTMALQGQRQVGFITGASGIGKTALVDTFVAQVSATEALWVGHGQCIERYGPGEPYLPVLEALGRLSRGIALLAQWPETPERARQELLRQAALGPALMVTQGFGHPEVECTYARARSIEPGDPLLPQNRCISRWEGRSRPAPNSPPPSSCTAPRT